MEKLGVTLNHWAFMEDQSHMADCGGGGLVLNLVFLLCDLISFTIYLTLRVLRVRAQAVSALNTRVVPG